MSETGTFTSRVAALLRRRETIRYGAPAAAAVVIVGVLLGVFLTGGSDPDGSSGQSVDIADRTAESADGTVAPAEDTTPDTADAGVATPGRAGDRGDNRGGAGHGRGRRARIG